MRILVRQGNRCIFIKILIVRERVVTVVILRPVACLNGFVTVFSANLPDIRFLAVSNRGCLFAIP